MNTFPVKLAGFLCCFLVYPAYAINKSTVVNKTDQSIAVAWTALGCFHITYGHRQVCSAVVLNPGEGHKYQYNWGATNDHIHVGGYANSWRRYLVPGSQPTDYHHKSKVKGNCNLPSPNGRVVYITAIEIDEENFIINCDYEIYSPENIDLFPVFAMNKRRRTSEVNIVTFTRQFQHNPTEGWDDCQ